MFWGLVLEPSKKYTQKVDQTFHISQAALDLKSCDMEPIQLVVEYENSNFVLATLSKKFNIYQVPLDLIFKTGDEISFRTIGNGKVHLSGYHVIEDLDSMLLNGEEESDIEETDETIKTKGKRKKCTPVSKGGKKARLDDTNEDESEDDDFDEEEEDLDDEDDQDDQDEDSEDEDELVTTTGKKTNKKKLKGNSLLRSMDDDDDDDDDEDEDNENENENENEDDDYDDEMEDDDDDDDDDDGDDNDDLDDEENETDMDGKDLDSVALDSKEKSNKSKNKKVLQTPNGVRLDSKGEKQSPQKQNKNLKQEGKDMKTPKSEEKQKVGEKKPRNVENTPQRKNSESGKKEAKTPKTPKPEGSPQKKVLEGGVISEEIRVGNGPVAKPGKMVNVYYVGTLASTKKEFDSVQNGGGFKFRLGRNEVIKGWDIGVVGMKVGGKRKLTIPPHLAYGSKGSPPVIPPNSTLVFTVELKGLS